MSPLKIGVKGDVPTCAFKSLCIAFESFVCIQQINSRQGDITYKKLADCDSTTGDDVDDNGNSVTGDDDKDDGKGATGDKVDNDGNGVTGDEVNNDGNSATGNDDDDNGDGAPGCNNEDDGNECQRATKSTTTNFC